MVAPAHGSSSQLSPPGPPGPLSGSPGPGSDGAPRPFREVPRPQAHPIFGNLPDWLGKSRAEKVLDTLQRYEAECGALVRVPLGPMTLLVVNDPELAGDLLNREEVNAKGWSYILTRVVLDNVLLQNGEIWAQHRRRYRQALRHAEALPHAADCLEVTTGRIAAASRGGTPVDMHRELLRLTGNTICRFLCGADLPDDLDDARARIQYELAAIGIDMQCQPWAYLSPYRWVALFRAVRVVRRFFAAQVARRRREGTRGQRDVLEGFFEQVEAGEHPPEDDAVRDALANFFFTAHDVVTASTTWCLWLLASHPEVQDCLRAALAAEAEPAYLAQVVRESLRLYPGYPLFGRRTLQAIELGGYRIPAGTEVIVSPRVIHRSPTHWPDPERFDPGRWADAPERTPPPYPQAAYFPFGAGRRHCIASFLAYPLLQRYIATLISRFRFHAPPGYAPEEVYWGSSAPAGGLPLTVEAVL